MLASLQRTSRSLATTCQVNSRLALRNARAAARNPTAARIRVAPTSSALTNRQLRSLRLAQGPRPYSTTSNHASARRIYTQALTGYAFAGKPRDDEAAENSEDDDKDASTSEGLPKQGFPTDSQIGAWVEKMLRGSEAGEDALAVTPMKGEGDWLLAVADGVGGWRDNGVDPALFSQSLMYHAAEYAKQFHACPDRIEAEELAVDGPGGLKTPPPEHASSRSNDAKTKAEPGTPLDILEYAYRNTLKQKEVPAGSATACMLTFDASKGVVRAANLGDSGFLILRPNGTTAASTSGSKDKQTKGAASADGEDAEDVADVGLHVVHHQSRPQTHGFNTPLQLSKLPPQYRIDGSIDSQPANADSFSCRLLDGDIVLVATDGFWDNVSVAEVLQLVAFVRAKHRTAWLDRMSDLSADDLAEERDLANVLAHNLLQYARMCQFSTTKQSPFERDAARHGMYYPGGKIDDVAILSALIVER